MARAALSLTLELDAQDTEDTSGTVSPISGRVLVANQPDREFVGWLQLMAYLDEAIRGTGSAAELDLTDGKALEAHEP